VWSVDRDTPDPRSYFPVLHKPDVVGIDVYERDPDSPKYAGGRTAVTTLGGMAPFALTEVGVAPSAKVLDAVSPAWVLLWGGEYLDSAWALGDCPYCNRPEQVTAFFKLNRVITRDELPAALRATISAGVVDKHPLRRAPPYCPVKLH
jgi:hypothetical protein